MSSLAGSQERGGRGRSRGSDTGRSKSRSASRSQSPEKRSRNTEGPTSEGESPVKEGGEERRGRSRNRRRGRRSGSGKRSSSAGGDGSLSRERSDRSRSGRSRSSRSGRSRSGSSKRGKSRSPPKFGEHAFDKKSSGIDVRKRQSAIAKVRGLKADPSEWTRQELADKLKKFSRYNVDSKTNVAELIIENKRFVTDDMLVLHEALRRFTEIQTVKITNCYVNDEAFVSICSSLRNLRHLKHLSLDGNLLTSASSVLIIRSFSKATRKLQVLDVRGNSFLYQDGVDIHRAFPYLNQLCGINLEMYANRIFKGDTLDVSKLNLKLPEIGMVCSLLSTLHTIEEVKINNNLINSKGVVQLVEALAARPLIQRIDLSYNPITNDSTDFKGLEKLVEILRRSKQFTHIKFDGIPNLPPYLMNSITQSLQVNRSINSLSDGYYFSKFVTSVVEKKTALIDAKKPSTETGLVTLKEWKPKLDTIDYDFVRRNKLSGVTVKVTGDDISATRVPYPKYNQYTF